MAWDLKGNSGTNPVSNFLGTTDLQPVVVKTNNKEVVRIHADKPDGKVDVAAQEITVTGFHPFITFCDNDSNNMRSFVQGVNGDIVLSTESSIGSPAPPMVLKNDSGNLGIGTLDPTSKVEIIAQDGLAVTGFQPFITLRDANAGDARGCIQCVDGDIALIPDSFLDGGDHVAMVLKNGTGSLGLGTAHPFGQLEIVGNAPFITLRDTAGFDLGHGHGRSIIQGIEGNIVLKPSSGDAQALVLMTGTGNVGLGVRQALARLHMVGHLRVDNGGGVFEEEVLALQFVQVSDRNAKANFSDVDTRETLERLTGLPIQKWNYKTDPANILHIGPTAQDFQAAFGLNGDDDVHISGVDAQGIALAAIQGLNEKLNAENERLRTSLVSLEIRLAALESNLAGPSTARSATASIS